MLRFVVFLTLLAAASIYAFRRGGTPEKQVAAVLVGLQMLDNAFHLLGGRSHYREVDPFHVFNDAWPLAALLAVALTANRFWPLWVAALQMIATFAHYARFMDVAAPPMAYSIMTRAPIWIQVLILLLGTWNHDRRNRARTASAISPPS